MIPPMMGWECSGAHAPIFRFQEGRTEWQTESLLQVQVALSELNPSFSANSKPSEHWESLIGMSGNFSRLDRRSDGSRMLWIGLLLSSCFALMVSAVSIQGDPWKSSARHGPFHPTRLDSGRLAELKDLEIRMDPEFEALLLAFLATPDPDSARAHLQKLTEKTHIAGRSRWTADYVAEVFEDNGLETWMVGVIVRYRSSILSSAFFCFHPSLLFWFICF